jgi:hypothetical protein
MPVQSAIYGLFPGPHAAERASLALREAGIAPDRIVVISPEPFEEFSFARADSETPMPWIAVGGGVVGGTCGFLLAWYSQVSNRLVTGGMPIVAPWPTGIVTYELTMMGAVLTTVIALLISTRLPSWKPRLYDPEVSRGKVLIGVLDPSDTILSDIEELLRHAGAEKIRNTDM